MLNRGILLAGWGVLVTVISIVQHGFAFGFSFGVFAFLFHYGVLCIIIAGGDFLVSDPSRKQALYMSFIATVLVFLISILILYIHISSVRGITYSLFISILYNRFTFNLLVGIASLGYSIGIQRSIGSSIYTELGIGLLIWIFLNYFQIVRGGGWSSFVLAGHIVMGIGAGIAAAPLTLITQKRGALR